MRKHNAFYAIVLVMIMAVVSCAFKDDETTSLYQPSSDSPVNLTFSYPSNWRWEHVLDFPTHAADVIFALDPYAVPDTFPGRVKILAFKTVNANAEMENEIEGFLKVRTQKGRALEIIDSDEINIDGYPAKLFITTETYKVYPYQGKNQPYYIEDIFISTDDRFYWITFHIPNEEIGGQFHQEFKALVESIKVLP